MIVIQGSYDFTLVGFSILAAIIAAYVSIDLIDMYLSAQGSAERRKWRIFSATTLGLGIWIMHFMGMFAFKLPMAVHYDGLITIVSLLVSIVACNIGIRYIRGSYKKIGLFGGLFMGAGIASMHYLGMFGMHVSAGHSYDPLLVALSVLVAIVVSSAGLLLIKNLHDSKRIDSIPLKLMAAIVLGLAVSLMHYLGMTAMTFYESAGHSHAIEHSLFVIDNNVLMAELFFGGMILLMFSFYTVSSEQSALKKLHKERLLLKSSEKKLSTLLDNIADAVVVIDIRGEIDLFNRSAEVMFGYSKKEMMGKNISVLMTGMDSSHHDDYMHHYIKTGESKIIDVGTRQLTALNKQGHEILIGLSVNEVETEEGLQFIGVMRDMTEHRRELDKLTERADYDSLTGLVNRHKLFVQLEHAIAVARRNETKVCFMFIDLDGFKAVNDNCGHDAGDELLRQVAVNLREETRESDIVARFGGDEFCVLLEGVKGCEGMSRLADKIIASFQSPFQAAGNAVDVTASIGIAFYPDDSEDDGELIKHADSAMYEAKNAGKNQYKFFKKCCD